MLLMEYDYATDIEVQREEAFAQGISQGLQQGIQQGVSQGEHQAKIETAKNMLLYGDSVEKISKVTSLSIDEIKNLQ